MIDIDESIHRGLEQLMANAPDAPAWTAVERCARKRRHRRTAVVAVGCVVALAVAFTAITRLDDHDTVVVSGPSLTTIPCGAWYATHTLFDSTMNSNGPAASPPIGAVTAEQAAFLVKSGDVSDRVADELGGTPTDLASRVTVEANANLGTVRITAAGDSPEEAQRLADAYAGAALASVQDIQLREIDRQRDVLSSMITQLELELAGVTGNERDRAAARERLATDISGKKVQLQELDQQAAQGSNIYSFGSAQPFKPSEAIQVPTPIRNC